MPTVNERIILCDQGSKEWFDARMACVTSCRVADVIHKYQRASKAGEESTTRANMRFEVLCEKLSGKASEHFVSQWMEEGKEKESLARAEYELRFDVMVEQVGFVYHPTIKFAGASPDGLVDDDGLIEIKCPKMETHLKYVIADAIPDDYLPQMLWQLACEDTRLWIDFVSYHPDVPEPYNLFIKRLDRTKEVQQVIAGMELEVVQFLAEVEEMAARFKR